MCQDFISLKITINKILEFKMIMYNTKLTATNKTQIISPSREGGYLILLITFLNSLQFLISTILFTDLQAGYSCRDWALNIKQHPKLVKEILILYPLQSPQNSKQFLFYITVKIVQMSCFTKYFITKQTTIFHYY